MNTRTRAVDIDPAIHVERESHRSEPVSEETLETATAAEELESFNAFARVRLSNGGADLSLDELFDLWRHAHPSNDLYAENVAAVAAAAIEDFRRGDRGTPAGEDSNALRKEFGVEPE